MTWASLRSIGRDDVHSRVAVSAPVGSPGPVRIPLSEPIRKGYIILPSAIITTDHKVVAHCKTKREAFFAFLRAVNGELRESDLTRVKRFCVIEVLCSRIFDEV